MPTATHASPIRLVIRGTGFTGPKVSIPAPLKASNIAVNASGTYLFADIAIPSKARPGDYSLTIQTTAGQTKAPFSLVPALPTAGRFQGFSPHDMIYLIMPDRFSNGDPANDQPLNDRTKSRYYHGGDFQGIIDHLDYLQSFGVTAL